MTLGIFANCIFCLKVKYLPRQQKKKLQADIKENGGEFSFLLNPQCTHIILDNADIVLSRCQLNSIQKNDVQIANPDFIWDSVKERRLLDVKNYDLQSLAMMPPPSEKSCAEVETEDVSLDNTPENDNTEVIQVSAENVEIPHFLQDFEVAKYNILEKVGVDGGQETVVVELQCPRDPGPCPFVVSAHFLLAGSTQRPGSRNQERDLLQILGLPLPPLPRLVGVIITEASMGVGTSRPMLGWLPSGLPQTWHSSFRASTVSPLLA